MRNGMSVEEVYERLEHCDRLEKAFNKIFDRYFTMRSELDQIMTCLLRTVKQYGDLTKDPLATKEDILEFQGKVSGLEEAIQIVGGILDQFDKPVEEDESDGD